MKSNAVHFVVISIKTGAEVQLQHFDIATFSRPRRIQWSNHSAINTYIRVEQLDLVINYRTADWQLVRQQITFTEQQDCWNRMQQYGLAKKHTVSQPLGDVLLYQKIIHDIKLGHDVVRFFCSLLIVNGYLQPQGEADTQILFLPRSEHGLVGQSEFVSFTLVMYYSYISYMPICCINVAVFCNKDDWYWHLVNSTKQILGCKCQIAL